MRIGTLLGRFAALFAVACALAVPAVAQTNLPPASVYARAYAGWNLTGQQANTYTFNGGVCNYSPYNSGNTPAFFIFSGLQASTAVYYPVAIIDANPSLSEIVTPTSTVQGSGACGFSAATTNQHVSFTLQDGTAGLQPAIATQNQGAPIFDVILDKYWYQSVAALPGTPSAASIISAVKGNANVGIVDTTTLPWTFYGWNGTAYAAVSGVTAGVTPPTAAAGAAAGTAPTIALQSGANGNVGTVALTAGTATTTGTIFTLTWPTTGSFTYPPTCTLTSTGTNQYLTGTTATTFSGGHAVLTFTEATAPLTASTAYQFTYRCS